MTNPVPEELKHEDINRLGNDLGHDILINTAKYVDKLNANSKDKWDIFICALTSTFINYIRTSTPKEKRKEILSHIFKQILRNLDDSTD